MGKLTTIQNTGQSHVQLHSSWTISQWPYTGNTATTHDVKCMIWPIIDQQLHACLHARNNCTCVVKEFRQVATF